MSLRLGAIAATLSAAIPSFFGLTFASAAHAQNRGMETVPAGRAATSPDSRSAAPQLKVLYRFSGVRDGNAGSWQIATVVICTNPTAAPINVRLRLQGMTGFVYANATYTVQAGYTHTAVTRSVLTYQQQLNLNVSAISQGFGAIFSDSPNLYCQVQVMDPVNGPPTFATTLQLERNSNY